MNPSGTAERSARVGTPARVAPKGPSLGEREVEVWHADLDRPPLEAVEPLKTLLSPDEQERAQRFFFERDRRRFIVGRATLRLLLSRYLDRPPEQLAFAYGPNGKPALDANGARPPIFFNVAHSDALALYAFTRLGDVGVDVERVRALPEWEQVAEAAFSPRELERLRACPAGRRREEFFHAWTRQEAVLKALGSGLGAAAVVDSEHGFLVHPLKVKSGYAAALAMNPLARWQATIFGWDDWQKRHEPFARELREAPSNPRPCMARSMQRDPGPASPPTTP